MKKLPTVDLLNDIAIELGVEPAFVEKDWFAIQVLSKIASIDIVPIIFTGGTSLSKAFGLIKRFSEDLDFRICTSSSEFSRGERKAIRKKIVSEIEKIDKIRVIKESVQSRNESKFFSLNLEYPQYYDPTHALRPHLKLEFSFEDTLLDPEVKDIRSFVSLFTDEIDCSINTISPLETAANKYSALLWRINIKDRSADRGTPQNDPTMIRHLHDLAALIQIIRESGQFAEIVNAAFKRDQGRGGSDRGKSIPEMSEEALWALQKDNLYEKEYEQFVDAMSYAPDDERIEYLKAVEIFETITSLF